MAKRTMVSVNENALKVALAKRGVGSTQASIAIGCSSAYLSNCMMRGVMSEASALLLETISGIKREEYAAEVKPPVVDKAETAGIDYDRMYQVLYSAMYNAYKQVIIDRKAGKF